MKEKSMKRREEEKGLMHREAGGNMKRRGEIKNGERIEYERRKDEKGLIYEKKEAKRYRTDNERKEYGKKGRREVMQEDI